MICWHLTSPLHFPWLLCEPTVVSGVKREGQAEQGNAELLPKTLNSFSGFVWLAQILRTFTFCGELLRINGVTRDSWIEPQECRSFYIYRDVWLLRLPSIGPLPLRYPADLHTVLSAPPQPRLRGPAAWAVGKAWAGQSAATACHTHILNFSEWPQFMWRQRIVDSRKASLNIAKTSRLEMIAYMCISYLVHTTTSWQICCES